ncbi:MAG TPA: pilin [Nevskiales bacterium]|nr:pilin [Nevskiales bacterium]
MRQAPRGFTLIELMIAFTVVGILVAIAIPIYQLYATRAKVTQGFALASSAKTAIAEYHLYHGRFPADNASAGLEPPANYATVHVRALEILDGGEIRITFRDPALDGQTLSLRPTATPGSIGWSCQSSLPRRYLPLACQ